MVTASGFVLRISRPGKRNRISLLRHGIFEVHPVDQDGGARSRPRRRPIEDAPPDQKVYLGFSRPNCMTDSDLRERMANDPFCDRLGIELLEVEPGTATTRLELTEDLVNFRGTPHGGALNALADAAFAAASNSHGDLAVGMETNISFLASPDVGDTVTAHAEETHVSRRTGEYMVVITDGSGDRLGTFRGRVYRP